MAKSIIPRTKWSASKTALLNLLIEHGGQTIAELSNSLGGKCAIYYQDSERAHRGWIDRGYWQERQLLEESAKDIRPHRIIRIFSRHRYRKAKSHLRHL